MTPEERLAALEERTSGMKDDISEIKGDVKSLVAAFNMGRGRAISVAKLGGLILVVLGGLGWAWDHVVMLFLGKH